MRRKNKTTIEGQIYVTLKKERGSVVTDYFRKYNQLRVVR